MQRTLLGVGIATLDLINEVEAYPIEDSEIRASAHRRARGGNVTNSLVVLAQLGHKCRWVGTLGDDPAADIVLADLAGHGVDIGDVVRVPGGTTPTSYIALSRATGSRTIIHFRDLPELDAASFERVSLGAVGWAHFEGRNPEQTNLMMGRIRAERPDLPMSLELEKSWPGMECLLDKPQVVLAGKGYAEGAGFVEPVAFLEDLMTRTTANLCVVAWGEEGASYLVRGHGVELMPAYRPPRIEDTLGAGDVFNAGVLDGLIRRLPARAAVASAVRLAGAKCGRAGLALADQAR